MYKQKLKDGAWKALAGNIRFSDSVFQNAESLTEEQRGLFDVFYVTETKQPQVNYTFSVEEGSPEFVNGHWVQTWLVKDATEEQIKERTAVQSSMVRSERDQRLAATDWIVIKHLELNENIPGVWEVYRQALRDIPQQAGFPWEVQWPAQSE